MEKYPESLFPLIVQSMADFAKRIVAARPSAQADTRHYSNPAFLLRCYAGLVLDAAGQEVAVTVDVQRRDDGKISIASDLCMDNGTIVLSGPAPLLPAHGRDAASREAIKQWQEGFERFLAASETAVLALMALEVAEPAREPEHGNGPQNTRMF